MRQADPGSHEWEHGEPPPALCHGSRTGDARGFSGRDFGFPNISATLWKLARASGSFEKPEKTMSLLRETIRSTATPDGGIVLDIAGGRLYSLNPAATVVFQSMERGLSRAEAAAELSRRFGIPGDVAANDVREFSEALEKLGLLVAGSQSRAGTPS